MKYFYSDIVEIEEILVKLDELNLTDEQKIHLSALVDSTLHHTILDLILSKLSDTDKKAFLHRLQEDPENRQLMEFLTDKIDGIEDEITRAVKKLKEELHEDLKEARQR